MTPTNATNSSLRDLTMQFAQAGKLEATFTIDEQGNLTKIRITQILDIESATEFIRVLKMCPKWEPAKRGGKPINIEIKYPMIFK